MSETGHASRGGRLARDEARFPVDGRIDAVREALASRLACVLVAPPGSGKTTRVPLALVDEPWLAGRRVVMLEPRRLAARMASRWIARSIGEDVGRTVGYRTRGDSCVSGATRLEVVTEGILTRAIQDDPSLEGVGAIVFDEFHERSLHADVGLAFALDARSTLRGDLRLLVMSATIDAPRVARLIGDPPAPVVSCEGRAFPVETRYAARLDASRLDASRLEERVARAVRAALAEEAGGILVFLPGEAEIRRVERLLGASSLPPRVDVRPLYGALGRDAQDRAVAAAPAGTRAVVLATSIAESSLTIEGIRVVVDAGRSRSAVYSAGTGMTRLVTRAVSRASADQRRGRAGRTGPGVCYRLWTREEDASLVEFTPPEIESADLASLALDLARWGARSIGELSWMSPPPRASYDRACELLVRLGALDADGRIAAAGTRMHALGAHPRLARMMIAARSDGERAAACAIAALLDERDVLRGAPGTVPCDIRLRLEMLGRRGGAGPDADRAGLERVAREAERLRRRLRAIDAKPDVEAAGRLVALAYPDRVARRRAGATGRFLMVSGGGVRLDEHDALAGAEYLAVASLDGSATEARVFLAAPLAEEELRGLFAGSIERRDAVRWDRRAGAVAARREEMLGAIELASSEFRDAPAEAVARALCEGVAERGIESLPWDRDARSWRERVAFLHRLDPAAWPEVSDAALAASLESWLAPFLGGMTKLDQLARVDMRAALGTLLEWRRARELEHLAPTHVDVPSGARVRIDYSGERPGLPVQIQKMFGARETPCVAGGRVRLLVHFLSPAQRPVQVTDDLASFWANAYPELRKELRGRYPKHPWPEDPLSATPTNRTKRR